MAPQRLGIYGGTFDPVHFGHLVVAEEVRDVARLDCVVFVPNRVQPLKQSGPWASGAQRLAMLQAAVLGNNHFGVDGFELAHRGASYTIETLDALRKRWPTTELRFILGADAANSLPAWRLPQRIVLDYRPIVMSRTGWPALDWRVLEGLCAEARQLVSLIDVPAIGIASSDVRDRVAAGRSIRYLVPDAVREIIEAEGLYRG